jgi:hypothetical protein
MAVRAELLEKAVSYVAGDIDSDALDMWLAEHAQELARLEDDDPMAQLSGLVLVTLAEMDDHAATESDLESRVREFFIAYEQRVIISTDSLTATTGGPAAEVMVSSGGGSPQPVEYIAA